MTERASLGPVVCVAHSLGLHIVPNYFGAIVPVWCRLSLDRLAMQTDTVERQRSSTLYRMFLGTSTNKDCQRH
jgi:hypothetical protein